MVGSAYIGSNVRPGFRWAPFMEKSGEHHGMMSLEELIVDPYLPTVALDPYDMARAIIIPSGRFVSIGLNTPQGATRFPWNGYGKTPLTLHDGQQLTPVGFSVNQMYRESTDGLIGSNTVKFRRGFVAELPFVPAINNANGVLNAGDKITGYFGSTTATVAPSFAHRGRPVKWLPLQTYYVKTAAASGIVSLSAAIYPGIVPSFVYVKDASGNVLSTVASSLVWNSTAAVWQYVGTAAKEVLYTWGQTEDQIGGEVVRIQSLEDLLDRSNFLRWVEYMQKDPVTFPPFTPSMQRRPAEGVINEALTFNSSNQARVANYEMDIHHEVHLQIQGTITYDDGTTVTYDNWYTLPGALKDIRAGFYGKYHTINWRTGVQVASNVTISAAQISYYYVTDSREAHILWGGGIINLTDGGRVNPLGNRNPAGLPAQLDLPDVTAAMRIIIK